MKFRRAILGGIVLVGVLILALAVAGVFSPEPASQPPEDDPDQPVQPSNSSASKGGGDLDITARGQVEGFEITGEGWKLSAPKAVLDIEAGIYELIEPELLFTRVEKEVEQKMTLRADVGSFVPEKGREKEASGIVRMSGHVRAEFTGKDTAVLTTTLIEVDLNTAIAGTSSEIVLTGKSEEGRHSLKGTDAKIDLRKRTVRIEKKIRIELSGGSELFGETPDDTPPDDAKQKEPLKALKTVVTCDGPILADGFTREIELHNKVVITQGEHALRADRMDIRVGEETREPERISASGNVTFEVGGVEGACDKLSRTSADKQFVMTGKPEEPGKPGTPARITSKGLVMEAEKLIVDAEGGHILAPQTGLLRVQQQAPEGQTPLDVTLEWHDSMRLDREAQEAVLRGKVRFTVKGVTVDCEKLTVKFDEKNGSLVECRAEENVKVSGKLEDLMPPEKREKAESGSVEASAEEMTYDPIKETLALIGKASLEAEGRSIKGDRIELDQKAGTLVLTGKASIKDEGLSIESNRIELDQRAGTLRVVGAGSLNASHGEGESLKRLTAEWAKGMYFEQAKGEVTCNGKVSVNYAGHKLEAQTVMARIGEENTLESLHAKGNVSASTTGKDGETPWEFHAADIVAIGGTDEAIESVQATGKVVVERKSGPKSDPLKLQADEATAKIGEDNEIESLTARGNITLDIAEAAVEGGHELDWEWHPPSDEEDEWDEGVLTGLPGSPVTLRRGQDELKGDQVEFSQKSGRVRVTAEKRVTATLVIQSEKLNDILGQ